MASQPPVASLLPFAVQSHPLAAAQTQNSEPTRMSVGDNGPSSQRPSSTSRPAGLAGGVGEGSRWEQRRIIGAAGSHMCCCEPDAGPGQHPRAWIGVVGATTALMTVQTVGFVAGVYVGWPLGLGALVLMACIIGIPARCCCFHHSDCSHCLYLFAVATSIIIYCGSAHHFIAFRAWTRLPIADLDSVHEIHRGHYCNSVDVDDSGCTLAGSFMFASAVVLPSLATEVIISNLNTGHEQPTTSSTQNDPVQLSNTGGDGGDVDGSTAGPMAGEIVHCIAPCADTSDLMTATTAAANIAGGLHGATDQQGWTRLGLKGERVLEFTLQNLAGSDSGGSATTVSGRFGVWAACEEPCPCEDWAQQPAFSQSMALKGVSGGGDGNLTLLLERSEGLDSEGVLFMGDGPRLLEILRDTPPPAGAPSHSAVVLRWGSAARLKEEVWREGDKPIYL